MLRIDENSKTLVSPQADSFVADAPPEQGELTALVSSSWDAFAGEMGQPNLRFCAQAPAANVDMIAFDADNGRAVVIQMSGDDDQRRLGGALAAAAEVSRWDASRLAEVSTDLSAAIPGDSPSIVLVVSGGLDESLVPTLEWLTRRHALEISAFAVNTFRFGSERLLNVRREFPPRDAAQMAADAAAMQAMLGNGGDSIAPPGI